MMFGATMGMVKPVCLRRKAVRGRAGVTGTVGVRLLLAHCCSGAYCAARHEDRGFGVIPDAFPREARTFRAQPMFG